MKYIFPILIFFSFVGNSIAQKALSTKSKKAAELYYTADNFRVRGQYNQAIGLLEEAISKDKKFHEAYFRLAIIYKAKGNLDRAELLFKSVISLNQGNNAGPYFELSELYLIQSNYQDALYYAKKFLNSGSKNSKRIKEAERFRDNAEFAQANYKEDPDFRPEPLAPIVNKYPMQYFPVASVDQQSLIFTKRMGFTLNDDEDLVISHRDESGNWSEPESLSDDINSQFNEGTCTISADGRTLIFTSCYGREGYGSCDLYVSYKTGDEWSAPKNVGPNVNSSAWDSQPSLSADGRTIYFISNRKGGLGKRDIWISQKGEDDQWQKPKNAGNKINTADDEVSPFIHPNGSTLYFASNGRIGFGGFDIYYSEHDTTWQEPINLGSPINTGEDQVALFITADGKKAYYSHEDKNDLKTKGRIYHFDMPADNKLKYNTSYVRGTVKDKETLEPLNADIELYDLSRGRRMYKIESDSVTGQYLMVLKEGGQYALYVNKKGYLFESLTFDHQQDGDIEPESKDILLSAIKAGASVVLNNIFFDVNKYDIKPISETELDKVVRFLKANPGAKVEIAGHTDNTGTDSYNQILSTRRAEALYTYLLSKNIDKQFISAKGYGSTKPLHPNDSDQNRSKNRRIEFRILK